jgi:asparagine synthase (glutamine-hydrolysing)
MCGINGIIGLDPRESIDERRLRTMRDVLTHRGPDGAGLWIDGPVGLGHRRLAIVDVAGGTQPMSNETGSVWIVFNGEIYNHRSLRPALERSGHTYRTQSDTETILHLYEEEGERCVERLQGMFAFAIWDCRQRRLLLARDRLGIKPLYYARTRGEILFGSEIKAILAAGFPPVLNESVLPEFLATGFVSGDETLFRGIFKLEPGWTASWSRDGAWRQRQYWNLPERTPGHEGTGGASLGACAADLGARLRGAVQSHLMSDVPLGIFLSGGLDSSGLAALMAREVRDPIKTFSVGFSEREANELPFARSVADAIGAEHREIVVSPTDFFDVLPRLVWHEDEPIAFPSSVPLYFVSRLARDHVKVVLTGEGSDELFCGYNRYRVTVWNQRLGLAYRGLLPGVVRRAVATLIPQLPSRMNRVASRTFLALPPDPRSLLYENFAVFPSRMQSGLLADRALLDARDPYEEQLRRLGRESDALVDRMFRADVQTYLVELLMKQDQMSMAASIESRVPYLDHPLVEYAALLPPERKLRGWRTKVVLREALQSVLPREILTRRKMGFPVPVGRWLRTSFWPIVQEFVLSPRARERGFFAPDAVRRLADAHRAGTARHGDRLWLLVTLEMWLRIFFEREDPAALLHPAVSRRAS